MHIEEMQTLEIPLNKLLSWGDNVRVTGVEEGIGELADSIAAVGLLQGLVVKKGPCGKYAVIAGRRRLMALSRLADQGKVKANMPIPCRITPADAALPEISLTENVVRVPMHPAHEFEAFQRLINGGKSVADVAARFGVTEAVVLRRLALARVNPVLLSKYREGELNLELLQAFTLTDDHEAQAEIDMIEQRRDALTHSLDEESEMDEAAVQATYDQIDEIDHRVQAIRRNRRAAYSDEAKASCGVVISVGQNGEPTFVYGLLKKEDEKTVSGITAEEDQVSRGELGRQAEAESPAYSAALIETLTQYKTAAIAAEVSKQPGIALAALVHARVLSEFGLDLHLYRSSHCIQVSMRQAYLDGANGSPALASLEAQKAKWLEKLVTAKDELWPWCLRQDQQTLLELMAYLVARTVNGVISKSDADDQGERCKQADALASALQFDMNTWFTPTADNFFSRVPKSRIADALIEVGKPPSNEALKLKKAELATLAENEVRGTGWLPEPVRFGKLPRLPLPARQFRGTSKARSRARDGASSLASPCATAVAEEIFSCLTDFAFLNASVR